MAVINIKDGVVVIDVNILSIPELKAVKDYYDEETALLAFQYLHFMYDLESPYKWTSEYTPEEVEVKVKQDFRGDYNPKMDQVMIDAAEKMKELNYSVLGDLLIGLKENIRRISQTLKTEEVDTGRDGNINQFVALHKSIQMITKNYKSTEKDFAEEVQKRIGNHKRAIDLNDEEDVYN